MSAAAASSSSSVKQPAGAAASNTLTLGGGTAHDGDAVFYFTPARGWDRGTFRGFGKIPAAGPDGAPPPKLVHLSGTHSGTKDPVNNAQGRPILVKPKEHGEQPVGLAPRDVYIPLADTLAQKAPHDLLALPELHHSVLVHSMRERHGRDVCYTFLGSLLCYLNPFQYNIAHYAMSRIDEYLARAPMPDVHATDPKRGTPDELLPHPWSVAHRVFFEMRTGRKNHSVIISGESGSGKTEACKIVLHYLCCLSADLTGVERPPHPQQAQSLSSPSPSSPPSSPFATAAAASQATGPQPGNVADSNGSGAGGGGKPAFDRTLISRLIEKVNASNPIMEAFGNGKTSRNDNSSRFGKLLEVQFGSSGEIGGMKISPFLLEKSRCVTAAADERLYHSFYQLMAGASDALKAELKLKSARDFPMLSCGGSIQVSGVNDAKEFEITNDAFARMGWKNEERDFVWRMVAACLHLSTVTFVPKPDPEKEKKSTLGTPVAGGAGGAGAGAARAAAAMFETRVAENTRTAAASSSAAAAPIRGSSVASLPKEDPASQQLAAISPSCATLVEFIAEKLLHIDSKAFAEMLTVRVMYVGKEQMAKPMTILDAYRQRDTLQKHIYACLFYWIIEKINASTACAADFVPANTISILDIFGFEDFATGNSLEQLCINLANEALQRHYSYHVFVRDTEEITSEGVDAQMAPFADNKPCVDLIMGRQSSSLFSMLEDTTKAGLDAGKGDPNAKFLEQITLKHLPDYHTAKPVTASIVDRNMAEMTEPSHFFARSKQDKYAFNVKHFASSVRYKVDLFCEKNVDALKDHAKAVLFSSCDPLVQAIMEMGAMQEGNGGGAGGGADPASPFSPRGGGGGSAFPPASPLSASANAGGGKGAGSMGICGQFRRSLQELLTTLDNTIPNWIRCIRPHPKKAARLFDTRSVLEQLMATGVLETITQRQRNFPFRLEIPSFVHRFGVICAGTAAFRRIGRGGGLHEKCTAILASASTTNRQHAQVGRTKVFLRNEGLSRLERAREERVAVLSSMIGCFAASYASRLIHRQLQATAAQIRIRRWYRRWRWFRRLVRALIDLLKKKKMERDERQRQQLAETEAKERALLATLERTDRRPYHARHMAELLPLLQAATQHLVKVEPGFRDKIARLEFQERGERLVAAERVARKAALLATEQRLEAERLAFERAEEELAEEVNAARKAIRAEEKLERSESLEQYWAPIHREILKLAERIQLFSKHRDMMVRQLREDYEEEQARIREAEERRVATEARLWQSLNGPAAIKRDMEELLALGLSPEAAEQQLRHFFLSGGPSKMLAMGGAARKSAVGGAAAAKSSSSMPPSSSVSHGTDASRVTHLEYARMLRAQYEQSVQAGRTPVLPTHSVLDAAKEAVARSSVNGAIQRPKSPAASSKPAAAAATTATTSASASAVFAAAAPACVRSATGLSDKTKMYTTYVRALKDGLLPRGTTFNEFLEVDAQLKAKEEERARYADPTAVGISSSGGGTSGGGGSPTKRVSFNGGAAAAGGGFVARRI